MRASRGLAACGAYRVPLATEVGTAEASVITIEVVERLTGKLPRLFELRNENTSSRYAMAPAPAGACEMGRAGSACGPANLMAARPVAGAPAPANVPDNAKALPKERFSKADSADY